MALKFGSPAWRKKYMKKRKSRKNPSGTLGNRRKEEADRKRYLKQLAKREKAEKAALKKAERRHAAEGRRLMRKKNALKRRRK